MLPETSLPFTICIIEDDPWYGQLLQYQLALNPDYRVSLYASGKDFFTAQPARPDVVTIDYSLPDMNGDKLLQKLLATYPELPVIVISAQHKIATAVELLKNGATDYLIKDEYTKDLLWNAILKIRETTYLRQKVQTLEKQLHDKYNFASLLKGNSPAVRRTFERMERAAQTPVNVSISGETGTGKELVAKAIHMNSERRKQPFVAVNMAAIPSELVESELFGHEKGAFTGAMSRKIGKFEEANHGTLFLDEIGELNPVVQSKLLRVLQERELQRVGGSGKVKLDVRLMTATHMNLAAEVQRGLFREDLYYRIMGLPIVMPPLRERSTDILLLAKHFLDEFCTEHQRPPIALAPSAHHKLVSYAYPGNVRELKTVIEVAAVLSNGGEILPDDILFTPSSKENDFWGEEKSLKEYNRLIIRHHLDKYHNNVPLVAQKLDIGRSTIYKMLQEGEL